ncbi:MAG: peptidase C39, partial [Clostridia bacterium]|nr:peptidase C39 [Clostridia bacterium]
MKTPLSYQKTDYDCGPTTLLNALSCLFEREDIPPELVKSIMLYSMDAYNDRGECAKAGTSRMAMEFISSWIEHFGKTKKFPVHSEYLAGDAVFFGEGSRMEKALQQGGVIVARVMFDCWHYVLITGCKKNSVYLFDPYYRRKLFKFPGIEMIWDRPMRHNRRVKTELLN